MSHSKQSPHHSKSTSRTHHSLYIIVIFIATIFGVEITLHLYPNSPHAHAATTPGIPDEATLDMYDANHIYYYNPNSCVEVTSTSSSSNSIAGSNAAEKVWLGLLNRGFSKEQAAGIMGNLQGESGLNPLRHQDNEKWKGTWEEVLNKSGTLGIAQWTNSGNRKKNNFKDLPENLRQYFTDAARFDYSLLTDDNWKKLLNDISESDFDAILNYELDIIKKEIGNNPNSYLGTDVDKTANNFCAKFERPNPSGGGYDSQYSWCSKTDRAKYAQKWYDTYKDLKPTSISEDTSTVASTTSGKTAVLVILKIL